MKFIKGDDTMNESKRKQKGLISQIIWKNEPKEIEAVVALYTLISNLSFINCVFEVILEYRLPNNKRADLAVYIQPSTYRRKLILIEVKRDNNINKKQFENYEALGVDVIYCEGNKDVLKTFLKLVTIIDAFVTKNLRS